MSVTWPDGPPETVVLRDGAWVCCACFAPARNLSPMMMKPAIAAGSAHVHTVIEHTEQCAIRFARGG